MEERLCLGVKLNKTTNIQKRTQDRMKHRQLSSSTTETMMATVVIVVAVAVAAETAITKETTVATIEETVSAST